MTLTLQSLKEHRNTVLLSIIGFFVVCFCIFYWWKSPGRSSSSEYLKAYVFYQKWKADPETAFEELKALKKTLDRHVDLQGKFDVLLAEDLIIRGKAKEAEPFALRALKRCSTPSSHYHFFSTISLLMAKEEWQEALKASQLLKENMGKDEKFWKEQSSFVRFGSSLYAYNLVRIAFLEQVAGSPETELKAWEDLERYFHEKQAKDYHQEVISSFHASLRLEDVSLLDYLLFRKQALTSQ